MNHITDAFNYLVKGGFVMIPLLICSVVVIAIAIERYMTYKSLTSSSSFVERFCAACRADQIAEAQEIARQEKGLTAEIVGAAYMNTRKAELESYLESRATVTIARYRKKLNYLNLITTLAPLLGLLGTIIGMIKAFDIFNIKSGAPIAITGGIGEALIATATGLCVAVISLLVFYFYQAKMDAAITDMEACFNALLEAKVRGE